MLREKCVDIFRVNFESAVVDNIFLPPHQGEKPVFIRRSQISGREPCAAIHRMVGARSHVAGHTARAPQENFTRFTGLERFDF